ncbi:hypothetical protein H1230_13235 [Paenibacillus sp. 19GGS1-52]|uniref:hypothetical protein n=1 Tax=Paenibacillus sp. 19GGS1-52 TaxID=2758563 RepID=UPI001EFB8F01|nr:hypothetical protein [Paenibacillus sp. 19GGS1-52]ULO09644.1 hypothetical protein H1230_13235 [Paenibacillus sp. 19GGS1-52]
MIAEQNISEIEKIHSKIRNSRFIGTNIFFFASILIIIAYIYFSTMQLKSPLFIALPLIIVTPIFIPISMYKLLNDFLIGILAIIYGICFEILVGGVIFITLKSHKLNLDSNIIPLVLQSLFFLFLLYALFQSSRRISELWILSFFNKNYVLTASLMNGHEAVGRLVTITKKGDYIVKISDNEVLIKNNSISMLRIDEF